jgi:hypothetical protein
MTLPVENGRMNVDRTNILKTQLVFSYAVNTVLHALN